MKRPPTHHHRTRFGRPRRSGFTIIELVVAIGLTSVLLFLVSRVFFETQQVLTFGIKTSNALAHARALGTQFKTDTDAMLGPGSVTPRGYLIIFNGSTIAQVKQPDGTERNEIIRTDQIVFIRSGGEIMTSLTPFDDTTLSNDFSSDTAKVWYGHARRANTDGTAGGGLGTGLDTFANDWVLARHALLLDPTNAAGQDVGTAGAVYLNEVAASGVGAGVLLNQPASYDPPNATASFAYSDLTFVDLLTLEGFLTGAGNTVPDYLDQAFAEDTLSVLTQIDVNEGLFESWQSAQTHPYLAAHVSDFIVEFAADLNFDGQIDTLDDKGTATTADDDNAGAGDDPIYWYSVDSLTALGMTDTLTGAGFAYPNDSNGNPVLVTGNALINFDYAQDPSPGPIGHGKLAFIFRMDDDTPFTTAGTPYSAWPALIRIRYRIHDTQGRLGSIDETRLTDRLDNDIDGTIDEADEANISGRMFEHILAVPRP
ncbi:MAG: prepilin-type N-terminal cleavage/methylation domain-containing protein [Planctomycetota bacterium]